MKHSDFITAIIVPLIFIIFFPQLSFAEENKELPKRDVVVGIPSSHFNAYDVKDIKPALDIWSRAINKKLGKDYSVRTEIFTDMKKLAAEVKNGTIDVSVMFTHEFMEIRDHVPLEPVYTGLRNGSIFETYAIFINKDKKITSLGDLKNKKLMVCTASGEIPLIWLDTRLMKKGLGESRNFISSIEKTNKPNQAVLSTYFGQADGCVITLGSYATISELNPNIGKKLLLLETSHQLLNYVLCMRRGCDEEVRKDFKRVMLEINEDVESKQIFTIFRIEKIVPFVPSYFDSTVALLKEYRSLRGKVGKGK
jgi:ABC-type phosphate/phosphonate transport system substrate-binding protein